jgi:hypothetical protein
MYQDHRPKAVLPCDQFPMEEHLGDLPELIPNAGE